MHTFYILHFMHDLLHTAIGGRVVSANGISVSAEIVILCNMPLLCLFKYNVCIILHVHKSRVSSAPNLDKAVELCSIAAERRALTGRTSADLVLTLTM